MTNLNKEKQELVTQSIKSFHSMSHSFFIPLFEACMRQDWDTMLELLQPEMDIHLTCSKIIETMCEYVEGNSELPLIHNFIADPPNLQKLCHELGILPVYHVNL
ncbi:hypothetical protein AGMMS50249_5820 [candidate division SR1 bacterium]|nr:hypothetical protein AGMMS50249_5820 [candidate division SR1 bacterium]